MIAISVVFLGFVSMDLVNSRVRSFDKYHWLLLVPIFFPFLSIFFAAKAFTKTASHQKLFSAILILFNIGFAAVIFLTFSFSYWQF
jgi:hypothetical protein